MQIQNIILRETKESQTLSADITPRGKKTSTIYISAKAEHGLLYNDATPFLAGLLLPCMKKGEDIVIDGSVSTQLMVSLRSIMSLVQQRDIGFRRVNVDARYVTPDQDQG